MAEVGEVIARVMRDAALARTAFIEARVSELPLGSSLCVHDVRPAWGDDARLKLGYTHVLDENTICGHGGPRTLHTRVAPPD